MQMCHCQSTTPPETLDATECAALMRCSVAQVEELARAGAIPGLKLGRGWLFVRADLLKFLAEKARDAAAARRSRLAAAATTCHDLNTKSKRRRQVPPLLPTIPPPRSTA